MIENLRESDNYTKLNNFSMNFTKIIVGELSNSIIASLYSQSDKSDAQNVVLGISTFV